ncbi:MAPEG family protein [Dyella jiangningensis]|uniref:MAPEG family protein n=1 Tax=Dyella jiangningensis TaxID=1379159 RepID=A0A328P6D0_9GAMM|nr:MAPEG family protein [Dyella jiangningensis]RAO77827.1 hypothetical protein CA260_08195 [Dyella jiangningensis]
MPVELQVLAWSIVLGLVYVVVATTLSTLQRGLGWNASNRDGDVVPLSGAAARADRATRNFLETFGFFVAAVLAVVLAQRGNAHTVLGVQLYFWARVVYLPVYAIGIPYLRTLVWAASVVGIVLVLGALF